ncbi:MAG: hypothetical protein QGI45_00100, partial [Myxococcota bacterium]|nr:hypothetical protein [Myxococcota bacterium]
MSWQALGMRHLGTRRSLKASEKTQHFQADAENPLAMHVTLLGLLLSTALASQAPETHKDYQLIGFSKNEEVAAFEVLVKTQSETHRDTYSLIELWRVDSQVVLGTFRQGKILRQNSQDENVEVPQETLAAQNPEWMLAEDAQGWQRIHKQTRFQKRPVIMNNSTLRVSLDEDVQVHVNGDSNKIQISALPGSAIGYQPVIRLMNGQHLALEHLRTSQPEDQILNAQITAYHSPSG